MCKYAPIYTFRGAPIHKYIYKCMFRGHPCVNTHTPEALPTSKAGFGDKILQQSSLGLHLVLFQIHLHETAAGSAQLRRFSPLLREFRAPQGKPVPLDAVSDPWVDFFCLFFRSLSDGKHFGRAKTQDFN